MDKAWPIMTRVVEARVKEWTDGESKNLDDSEAKAEWNQRYTECVLCKAQLIDGEDTGGGGGGGDDSD